MPEIEVTPAPDSLMPCSYCPEPRVATATITPGDGFVYYVSVCQKHSDVEATLAYRNVSEDVHA